MEQALGRVIAIQTGSTGLSAEVEVSAAVACARCASGRGCGAALLGASSKSRRIEARIGSGIDVQEGDDVRMELKASSLLRASWLVYGTPLTAALVFSAVAQYAGLPDPYTVVAALAGVGAGIVIARSRLRRGDCLQQLAPTIVARLPATR